MAQPQDIQQLIIRHLAGTLSPEEQERLDAWLNESPINREAVQAFIEEGQLSATIREMYQYRDKVWNRLQPAITTGTTGTGDIAETASSVHRVRFLKAPFFRYAAAILVLAAIGITLYIIKPGNNAAGLSGLPHPNSPQQDIAPGGDKATLTLADGSVIVLDTIANGHIALQGDASVIKQADGQLQYLLNKNTRQAAVIAYNIMHTPKGGQYQISLPDGTRVWLNAASSITYPTAFSGKERKVSITGEAYFEVAANDQMPFLVKTGETEVQVLGTEFNISAYEDEQVTHTTLINGAVRINNDHEYTILKPGQQARRNPEGAIQVLSNVDTEAVTAWKNGYFAFHKADLPSIMRQLARWYDVTVEYQGKLPDIRFGGEISRTANLSEVLTILEESNIHFRIDNKKIIVHP